jgi:hypothetical protein
MHAADMGNRSGRQGPATVFVSCERVAITGHVCQRYGEEFLRLTGHRAAKQCGYPVGSVALRACLTKFRSVCRTADWKDKVDDPQRTVPSFWQCYRRASGPLAIALGLAALIGIAAAWALEPEWIPSDDLRGRLGLAGCIEPHPSFGEMARTKKPGVATPGFVSDRQTVSC